MQCVLSKVLYYVLAGEPCVTQVTQWIPSCVMPVIGKK